MVDWIFCAGVAGVDRTVLDLFGGAADGPGEVAELSCILV